MSRCFPSPFPVLPHQAPCRLSSVLESTLSRRFGSALVGGVGQAQWVARGGYLPGLMALSVHRGLSPESLLEKVSWASYQEPNPEVLPCGVFVHGQPDPTQWVWGLAQLFDRPHGLAVQCEQAWMDYLTAHASSLDWTITPWPGSSQSTLVGP